MLQGQTLQCIIIFITIFQCVYNFEVFVSKTKDNNDQNIEEPINDNNNKSYEIPLFQTHYLTLRTHANDFQRIKHSKSNVIGFKFQVQSTDPGVVSVRKEVMMSADGENTDKSNKILLEDLYIFPRQKALSQILNAYPSPTLIHPDQQLINDLQIDTIWSVEGVRMDITYLTIRLDVFYDDDTSVPFIRTQSILVTQPKRRIDTIFFIIIPFIVVSISVLMGILLDTTVIASIFKKPTPVIVGFVAQYGLMPFLAMAIAKIFNYTPLHSLALFVIGCCPGSGASNQWTVLFDGDVNLSAVMSFISTTASFFMMPLYFYTIGRLYMDELSIKVPFLGLARSLALVVIPYSIGITISHFFPKSRPFVQKLIKPMMIVLMLFFLTFGLVVNWYMLQMLDWYTTLTAPLLPFLGFIFGGIIALVCGMTWPHIKTIGIEAGIQNTGIAFMIFMYSFPQPYGTQAMIIPMVVSFLSTKPFWLILIIQNQVIKYQKRKELTKNQADGKLVVSIEKPPLNDEENNKNRTAENMQQL